MGAGLCTAGADRRSAATSGATTPVHKAATPGSVHIHSHSAVVIVHSSGPLEDSAERDAGADSGQLPPLPLNLAVPQPAADQPNGSGKHRPRMFPLLDGSGTFATLPGPDLFSDVTPFVRPEDTPEPEPAPGFEDGLGPTISARSARSARSSVSVVEERMARMRMMPRSYSARFTIKPPAQRVVELLLLLTSKYGFTAEDKDQITEAIHLIQSNQLYVPTLLETGDAGRERPASHSSVEGEEDEDEEDEDKELQEWLSDQLDVKARAARSALGAPKAEAGRKTGATFKSVSKRLVMSLRITKILMALARGLDSAATKMDDTALTEALGESTCWDFDVFKVAALTNGRPLFYTALSLLSKLGLNAKLNVDDGTMARFLTCVEESYKRENPYHNNVHAADVLQTTFYFLTTGGLMGRLDDMEVFSLLVACCVHDMEHPGTNNQYQIKAETEFALVYNDASPLENHHASAAFRLMRRPELNIAARFSDEQRRDFRGRVISMILATDMKQHFETVGNFKSRVASGTFTLANAADRQLLLNMTIKSADVSNPAKPYELSSKWAQNVTDEFFMQGDLEKERGLPLSPFCDRSKPAIPKSQIGFIDFIAIPMYETWCSYLEIAEPLESLHANRALWEQMCVPLTGPVLLFCRPARWRLTGRGGRLEAEAAQRAGGGPGSDGVGQAGAAGALEGAGGLASIGMPPRSGPGETHRSETRRKRRSSLYQYRAPGTPASASTPGGERIPSGALRPLHRASLPGNMMGRPLPLEDDTASAVSVGSNAAGRRDSARSGPHGRDSISVRSVRNSSVRVSNPPLSTGVASLVSILQAPNDGSDLSGARRRSDHAQHARFAAAAAPPAQDA